jgi:hypothetical protein
LYSIPTLDTAKSIFNLTRQHQCRLNQFTKERNIMTNITNNFLRTSIARHWKRIALAGFALTLCLMVWLAIKSPAQPTAAMPQLEGEEAVSYLKEQHLYGSLSEAMQAARYGIRRTEQTPGKELSGAYSANNPAQQMTAFFSEEGIHIETKTKSQQTRRLAMSLRQYGYGDNLLEVSPGEMKATGNRIEIERRVESPESGVLSPAPPDSRLVEWYENHAEGIEQGFLLGEALGEKQAGEWLRLRLEVAGELQVRLTSDGQAVELISNQGERVLRYEKLKVWDAEGRELPSRMSVEGDSVWLEMNDEAAVYPVSIDPIFTQQQKLTASDGAAQDQFGKAVAISGDTVIVGVFKDTVGASGEEGSAYVFVRSGTVWTELQKLTASDGAANDLFGGAVAISGDTIVVGAPFDKVGANQQQGSVYVFTAKCGIVINLPSSPIK